MNAYRIIADWNAERAHGLRQAASKAEASYTMPSAMARACRDYAVALRSAAALLDEHTRVFLRTSVLNEGNGEKETNG